MFNYQDFNHKFIEHYKYTTLTTVMINNTIKYTLHITKTPSFRTSFRHFNNLAFLYGPSDDSTLIHLLIREHAEGK